MHKCKLCGTEVDKTYAVTWGTLKAYFCSIEHLVKFMKQAILG